MSLSVENDENQTSIRGDGRLMASAASRQREIHAERNADVAFEWRQRCAENFDRRHRRLLRL